MSGNDTTSDRKASSVFSDLALWASHQCGRASTFVIACLAIIVWAITGPMFHFSDTWQLIINTGTTIVTFLMVFLIQNTQNRDMAALHLKLDELIRVSQDASNKLLDLEDMTEEELERMKGTFTALAENASTAIGLRRPPARQDTEETGAGDGNRDPQNSA
jgi:low affinity Fe/Cu permease